MRQPLPLITMSLLAAALLAFGAACSTNPDQEPVDGNVGSSAASTPRPLGPLEQYEAEVASIYGSSDETWNKQQELIAQCMAEEGFKYTPAPPAVVPDIAQIEAARLSRQQPQFYEKYGYGLSASATGQPSEPPSQPPDPNDARLAAMSGTELAAYKMALYGQGSPAGSEPREKGDTDTKWQDEGCSGKATHEVVGGPGSVQDPKFEALRKQIVQFGEQAWSSPEVAGAYSDWSACMNESGYANIAHPDDAPTFVMDNASKNGRDTPESQLKFEISVAKADYGCQADVSLQDRINKAISKAQAAFVAEHKAELDAWVQAAREQAGDKPS